MKTAIIYYSQHHGNTKKLLDAMAAADPDLTLIDATSAGEMDLSEYDRIGIASGVYYNSFAKQVLSCVEKYLPEGKPVFFVYTHGAPKVVPLKEVRKITQAKHCPELGAYHCQGFDTFGPFKLVGGLAKGHPTKDETEAAVRFYQELPV